MFYLGNTDVRWETVMISVFKVKSGGSSRVTPVALNVYLKNLFGRNSIQTDLDISVLCAKRIQ